jgi:thiamine-phosphate pyrophosphorylase
MAMQRRQTRIPERWLVVDERNRIELARALASLPRGSGVLLLCRTMPKRERGKLLGKLRFAAARRHFFVIDEAAGLARRVHNPGELRQALLRRTPLVLLSPLFPTASHPEWQPLPRMRAGALARLAGGRLIALGGMNERRFAQIRRLGFRGWAAIGAFKT